MEKRAERGEDVENEGLFVGRSVWATEICGFGRLGLVSVKALEFQGRKDSFVWFLRSGGSRYFYFRGCVIKNK